jgi:hypothetical protein
VGFFIYIKKTFLIIYYKKQIIMEQNIIDAATQGFNLPHDVIQLPTGGIFYQSKKKSVKVGYLTANDENYLIGSGISGENIILSLLRNKIYEHDLRPEELLNGDVEAILIFLRNTSFGPEYKVNLIDPKTDKPFVGTILLDELNIKQTSVKPDENGLFTTTLPKCGKTVKLKLTTFNDTIELDRMVSQYPAGRQAPRVTWKLNQHIVEFDGETDKGKIATYVETLPISDSKYIRKFLRDNEPSLDLSRQVIAPSGELVSFEITFGVDFFRPFF